jgi:hypothetical protein
VADRYLATSPLREALPEFVKRLTTPRSLPRSGE